MVCFLRLLSRTITPNRRRTKEVLRFQLVRPLAFSSEGDAHNGATDIKSDLNSRTFNRS